MDCRGRSRRCEARMKPRRIVTDPLQLFGNAVELDTTSRTVRVVHEATRAIRSMHLGPCSVLESL